MFHSPMPQYRFCLCLREAKDSQDWLRVLSQRTRLALSYRLGQPKTRGRWRAGWGILFRGLWIAMLAYRYFGSLFRRLVFFCHTGWRWFLRAVNWIIMKEEHNARHCG